MIHFNLLLLSIILAFGTLLNAQTFIVSPTGKDKNLKRSIAKLKEGDTLLLRGGEYPLKRPLKITKSITLKAYPNETPILDGSLPEFITTPNNEWEIVDAKLHIYRSTKTYPKVKELSAFLGEKENNYALIVYKDKEPFYATNERYLGDNHYYAGAGIFYDKSSHHIYVRLQHSRYQTSDFNFPKSLDPRKTSLHIGTLHQAIRIQGSNINIEGLTIKNSYAGVYIDENSDHINIKKCTFQPRYYGVIIRKQSNHIAINHNTIACNIPDWVPRSDVKRPRGVFPPAKSYHGSGIELADGQSHHIEIGKNTIQSCFDGVHMAQTFHDVHIHNNFFHTIRDDAIHMGSSSYNMEIDHNKMVKVYLGVSYHGRDTTLPQNVGSIYIHHNIIDTSIPQFIGREDPHNLLPLFMHGYNNTGWGSGRPFGSHAAKAITTPDPWKIYNNTLLGMDGGDRLGFGQCYRHKPFDSNNPHEVYNNIFLMVGNHYMGRECRIEDGSTKMDGNLYWRVTNEASPKPFFYNYDNHDFKDLNALKKQTDEKWEKKGIEADPQLNDKYIPALGSPAKEGGVDLSLRPWSGVTKATYRGAIAPY